MAWSIWLSHHPPDEHERCAWVGPVPVCRRCLATWPLALLLTGLGVAGRLPPASDLELVAWLGPPLGEYLAVHLGRLPYRRGRTWFVGLLAGIAAGRLFHRYLQDPYDPAVWTLLLGAGIPAGLAALWHTLRRD